MSTWLRRGPVIGRIGFRDRSDGTPKKRANLATLLEGGKFIDNSYVPFYLIYLTRRKYNSHSAYKLQISVMKGQLAQWTVAVLVLAQVYKASAVVYSGVDDSEFETLTKGHDLAVVSCTPSQPS